MPDERLTKGTLALGLLSLFPETIRVSVLDDHSFRQRFELGADATIRLEPSGLNLDRSKLFSAVRDLLDSNATNIKVTSKDGREWTVTCNESKQHIILVRDGVDVALPDFSCLSRIAQRDWIGSTVKPIDLN